MPFAVGGLLIAGLGVPLWLRKIGPNCLYGVRTRATLSDEGRWYDVNATAGRAMVVVGVLTSACSVGLKTLGVVGDAHTLAMAGVLIVGGAIVTFLGLWRSRKR
jgi:SdpI/YfhL protein family